jgi:hypothetical protein
MTSSVIPSARRLACSSPPKLSNGKYGFGRFDPSAASPANDPYLRKPSRDRVSRMMSAICDHSGSVSLAVRLRSAPPTPKRLLPRYRGNELCFRASHGPRGAARPAGSWFFDRSETAYMRCGGWNGSRKRPDRDQFPQPRNRRSGHTVWCSNEATHEPDSERESRQTQGRRG